MKPTEGSSPKCGECGEELGACPGCWAGTFCPNCDDDCSTESEPVRELKRIEKVLGELLANPHLSDEGQYVAGMRASLHVITSRIKELKS